MAEDKKEDQNTSGHSPVVIPPTEVARNPNPRANENLPDNGEQIPDGQMEPVKTKIGSEITDGESS